MRIGTVLFLLPVIVGLGAASAAAKELSWNDSMRDVFIDGRMDRTVQVLTCGSPRRLALFYKPFASAVILDLSGKELSITSRSNFQRSADGSVATSPENLALEPGGEYARLDNTTFAFAFAGRSILIHAHTGVIGELSLESLWDTVPVWRSMAQAYQPNPEAVAALRKINSETVVTAVLGTWCPDSKRYVPRMLRALELAGNDKIKLRLYGVDNRFLEPLALVQSRSIVNVPLFIIERDSRELGRIIETPAAATVEEDLAAILDGKPNVHQGRWEHGAEAAHGTYRCGGGSQAGRAAREQFTLFRGRESGYFIHSAFTRGDLSLELFQEADAGLRPSFVQLTLQQGGSFSRTRLNISSNTLTGRLKGDRTGVLEQSLVIPDRVTVHSSSVASQGWVQIDWSQAAKKQGIDAYILAQSSQGALGFLDAAGYVVLKPERLRIRAGTFQARRLQRTLGGQTTLLWLHRELPLPLKVATRGGQSCQLESLVIR